MNKPQKQNYQSVKFDPKKNLIVSMHKGDKSNLGKVINNLEGNLCTAVISDNNPYLFYALRKTGVVINSKAFDILFGNAKYDFSTFKCMPELKEKGELKLDTNNPKKMVATNFVSAAKEVHEKQRATDYTRYDISTKTPMNERDNNTALDLFVKAINYKDDKNKLNIPEDQMRYWTANVNELLISRNSSNEAPFLGVIVDISSGASTITEYLSNVFEENPNFNLYLFNNDKIRVVESQNVPTFLEDISKCKDFHKYIPKKDGELVEDFVINNSVPFSVFNETRRVEVEKIPHSQQPSILTEKEKECVKKQEQNEICITI